MSYTRRQELTCTLSELATYGDKVLMANEVLYVVQSDGKRKVMFGDGTTPIKNLPYTIDIAAIQGYAAAAAASQSSAANSATAANQSAQAAAASAQAAIQYTYVKYSTAKPTSDADLKNSVDENDQYMGIYTGPGKTAPTAYTSYAWIRLKGPTVRDTRDNAVYDMAFTVSADGYPAIAFTQLS